jgi:hypothetical protein
VLLKGLSPSPFGKGDLCFQCLFFLFKETRGCAIHPEIRSIKSASPSTGFSRIGKLTRNFARQYLQRV